MKRLSFSGNLLKLYKEAKKLKPAEACGKGDSLYMKRKSDEAVPFFYSAAERGDARGQLCIGNAYSNGQGVPQDYGEAFLWYHASINGDDRDPYAFYNLGYLYENGLGTPKNLQLAAKYYRMAVQRGHLQAPKCLENVERLLEEERKGRTKTETEQVCQKPQESGLLQENNPPQLFIRKSETYNPENMPQAGNPDKQMTEVHITAQKLSFEKASDNIDKYFDGIIGMADVKSQLKRICSNIRVQEKRNQILRGRGITPPDNARRYNFIITGNPGTGKTMVARIIAKILYDYGIRDNDRMVETDRSGLVGENIGSTALITKKVIDKARGGVLFIDEAYSLYKKDDDQDFGKEAIDTLVKDMEDNGDSYSVIIAGYKEPMSEMIRKANYGLESRFTCVIDILDYSDDELIEIAKKLISLQHYEADESVYNAIRKCIIHDRIDEKFGNARYIRELVNRAADNMSLRISAMDFPTDSDFFTFRPEDFWQGDNDEKSTAYYLNELNELVGLTSVKKEVSEIITRLEIESEMEKRGLGISKSVGTLHMAFKGNAGTGKTTVARLLGKLYGSLGVLKRSDVFVECSRADLVGMYQGHTASMVKEKVEAALGGVLFIDEAYSLISGSGDSFGKEALDTLVALMENNRDNLIVIFAGYGEELDDFLQNNQGLKSRIPIHLHFDDYSPEELLQIMQLMFEKKKLHLSQEALLCADRLIREKCTETDFGNARGIRNLVEKIYRQQNTRIVKKLHNGEKVTDEELLAIEAEDVV